LETNKILIEIFTDMFDIGKNTEISEINVDKIKSWDSLNHLNLIISIENKFGIDIPPDDFPRLYSNFGLIKDYIDSKFSS
tara:strand:+ start:4469 stop:4708 length:240 start_codon:yes stop_codon:yes gene_type:complete